MRVCTFVCVARLFFLAVCCFGPIFIELFSSLFMFVFVCFWRLVRFCVLAIIAGINVIDVLDWTFIRVANRFRCYGYAAR